MAIKASQDNLAYFDASWVNYHTKDNWILAYMLHSLALSMYILVHTEYII